jgi:hypothetical protein
MSCTNTPFTLGKGLLHILKAEKINLRILKYEFLNIYISHLAQFGMINITLKYKEKTYVKKLLVFTTTDMVFGS